MEILTDYGDLVGKTIAFSHMAQFAKQITIATEDGSILMATFDIVDDHGEEQNIRVLNSGYVKMILVSAQGKWLREELGKLGIFNLEEYQEEQAVLKKRENEKRKIEQEKRELIEYRRLREKYGHA